MRLSISAPKSDLEFWGNRQDVRKTRPQAMLRRSRMLTDTVSPVRSLLIVGCKRTNQLATFDEGTSNGVRSKIAANALFQSGLTVLNPAIAGFGLALIIVLMLSGCTTVEQHTSLQQGNVIQTDKAADAVDMEIEGNIREKVRLLLHEGVKRIDTDPGNALKIYLEAIKLAPNRWETHYNAGIAYLKLHNIENAEREFFASLKYKAPTGKIYNALGYIYIKAGKKTAAIEALKKAVSSENSSIYIINMANILQTTGRMDEAMSYYELAASIDPSNPVLHYNTSLLLYKMGEYKKAQKELLQTQNLEGANTKITFYKVQLLLKLGEHEAALKLLQDMIDKNPANPEPNKDMGIIYEIYLGDMEKALVNYYAYIAKGGEKAKDVAAWVDVVKAKQALKKEQK